MFAFPALALAYALALYPFTPSIGDIRRAKLEQPTVVLTADGKELAVFKRANRDWVKLKDISPNVVNALLATEDHRFYAHHGFDAKRTLTALMATAGGDRQGGSTITQQLARNLYPEEVGRAPTITRKIKELITAFKIEAVYSKDEILETYLNTVPFLYNAYGIDAAARTYFDKKADKLDADEAATLVGMLKGTSYYNPVLNPERAVQRRNTVLAQMVKYGKLPAGRFESLAKKPLRLDFERLPEFAGMAPHLAQNIRRWLIDWADRHDYDIYADGLVVRTSIDSRMQKVANEAVARRARELQGKVPVQLNAGLLGTFVRESSEYKADREAGMSDSEALAKLEADKQFMKSLKEDKTRLEASFLAIDPTNGYVKAWVGSRDYEDDKYDHVAQARRQPGSTFKPFVYAAAFEAGARPTDTFIDQITTIQVDRNQFWSPGDIHGVTNQPMTLREALVKSKNTITAQVMQQVGPARVAQVARAMGVRQSPLEQVPSLALGTSPVTLREMVSGYATIANNGGYIEPIVVLSVEDRNHHVLEEFRPKLPEQSIPSEVAQTLLDVMRGVIDEGTGVGLRPRFGIPASVDLAGKTGTTQNYTDGWFIAMHPQLVMGAWMGFNDARITMHDEYWGQGAHNALFVVGDFLQQSLKNGTLDAKAAFLVPKDMSKGAPNGGGSMWDPLVGKVNDWWNSMFQSSGNDSAAVAQPTPVPEPPPAPPMPAMPQVPSAPMPPEQQAMPAPEPLPDSGAMPSTPAQRAATVIVGAPAPRAPDATIPALRSQPESAPVDVQVAAPSARGRMPQPALGTPPAAIDKLPGVSSWTPVPSASIVSAAPGATNSTSVATGSAHARAETTQTRDSVTPQEHLSQSNFSGAVNSDAAASPAVGSATGSAFANSAGSQ
ncbi:MAG TPA: transglycosylase domain-containing protein [Ramlibacter sp.]|nr:transglycosylase domain-containing protein [Ramlibacter sp.]HVZ46674.1 transglycosylase domain-containing protein [Ramlibacter sp.]